MDLNAVPFNISLFNPTESDLKTVREIKVLDITDGMSKNFHPDGLFSTEIFGRPGEEKRNRLFGYIDLHVPVFHPIVYKAISDLKGLYTDIISGSAYAVFDKEKKDFVKTSVVDGETGFNFFVKHFKSIEFEERPSAKREFNIRLVNKYRDDCMYDKLLVLPAGLRDYTIDDNNKPSEDEINGLYRKVLSVSSVISNINTKTNIEYVDSARYNIQQRVNEIYQYLVNLLEGKNKLIQSKWASRKIFDTTRNVITPAMSKVDEFFTPRSVSTNQTMIGLYQYMRGIMPLAVKHVRDTYLSKVFIGANSPAVLVNKKTLQKELVSLDPQYYDEYMTYEGLEKFMARFGQEELRDLVLEVEGYYLGLIYKTDKHVRFVQDVDELPEGFDKKNLRPITYCELLYLSLFEDSKNTPTLFTRYPITGYGSVYPSYVYLKTTTVSEIVELLGDDWQPTGKIAYEFPKPGEKYYNSMSPAVKNLARLAADFDGDMCSSICSMTEESLDEIREKLNDKSYHLSVNGSFAFSSSNDVVELVLANVLMDPE